MNDESKSKNIGASRRLRMGGYRTALIVAVIAVAVIVNMIVAALPVGSRIIDLTDSGMYDVSEQSKNFIAGIDEEVTLNVVIAESDKDPQLDIFLRSYAALSDKITLKYVDPEENPDFVNEHFDMDSDEFSGSLYLNSVVVESAKRSKTVGYIPELYNYSEDLVNSYYPVQYMQTGLEIYEAGVAPDIFDADYGITSAVNYVTTDRIPVAYILTGHGESELGASVSSLISAQSVTLTKLSLMAAGTVPADANAVVINVPATDITEREAEALNAFIDGGGSVILVTDVKTYTKGGMPNLTSVANHCGLDAKDGVVIENNDPDRHAAFNNFMLIESLESCSVTAGVSNPSQVSIVLLRPHAITEAEDYDGNMVVSPIVKSSEKASLIGVEDEYPNSEIGGGASDTAGSDDSGSAADTSAPDGESGSDVGSGGNTEIETGEFYLGAVSNDSATGASFTWFAAPYITSDMGAQYSSNNNAGTFTLSVTTVCEIEGLTFSIDSIPIGTDTLSITSQDAQIMIMIMLIILPIGFLAAGIAVYAVRRKR